VTFFVMAGQKARSAAFAPEVPATPVFGLAHVLDVDARAKRGHVDVAAGARAVRN